MAQRQPGRRPKHLRIDLVDATPEQIAECLIEVDPAKAGRVAYLVGVQIAGEGGAIGRTMDAADADPVGFVAGMVNAAVRAHGRPPGPPVGPQAVPNLLEWAYEDPESDSW